METTGWCSSLIHSRRSASCLCASPGGCAGRGRARSGPPASLPALAEAAPASTHREQPVTPALSSCRCPCRRRRNCPFPGPHCPPPTQQTNPCPLCAPHLVAAPLQVLADGVVNGGCYLGEEMVCAMRGAAQITAEHESTVGQHAAGDAPCSTTQRQGTTVRAKSPAPPQRGGQAGEGRERQVQAAGPAHSSCWGAAGGRAPPRAPLGPAGSQREGRS